MVSSDVVRSLLHYGYSVVTQFHLWNDVSIFCNSEVISRPTSGFAVFLILTILDTLSIAGLGQMLSS